MTIDVGRQLTGEMSMYTEIAEETAQLVEQARNGSESAFTELVRLHHHSVRSYLRRFLPRGDGVDDLAQQAFLVAYHRLDSFEGNSSFASWLIGIARNEALMFLRGEVRRKRREQMAAEAAISELHATWLQGSAAHDDHEATLEHLRSCLEKLPQTSRSVVQQYYFDNVSAERIANQLNKKSGSIRMMLLRIRRLLANCVTEKRNRQENQ